MFDPLAFPYVRAQTYTDGAAPAVLSGVFYNPVQDAIARLYGGVAGYSTLLLYEEFIQQQAANVPVPGTFVPFGRDLRVLRNTASGCQFASVDPTGPNQYGVYQISGVANGNRGGSPGFIVTGSDCWGGTLRWIFRARIRCSNFSPLTISPPGLVVGFEAWISGLPVWAASSTGFWQYSWDGGTAVSTIATIAGQWVTLWISHRDGDGQIRWYIKRDFDPLPILVDTRALTDSAHVVVNPWVQYQVTGAAVAGDNIQIDNISLIMER